jgi:integrase
MINRSNYEKTAKFLLSRKEIYGRDDKTISRYKFYLNLFLKWADERDFVDLEKDIFSFPKFLSIQPGLNGKGVLSNSTNKKVIDISKQFLFWVVDEYPIIFKPWKKKSILQIHPIFNITGSSEEMESVTIEEVEMLLSLPPVNLAMKRDQAAVAFLLASGMRISAFISMPIKAFIVEDLEVHQWPSLGVRTKNQNSKTTFLLEIPELIQVISEWDNLVKAKLSLDAPWYPIIKNEWGDQKFTDAQPGKNRNQLFDRRLRKLFKMAGLTYKSAHKFRHGHALYCLSHSQSMDEFKAISENLMHSSTYITDKIYFRQNKDERRAIMKSLGQRSKSSNLQGLGS